MVTDLSAASGGFPFFKMFFGFLFLWLGVNIRIVTVTPETKTED